MTAALQCRGLSKALGGRLVLEALDLDVAAGEVVSLLGASGSGKTTLLRAVAGLHDPDRGEIMLDGRVIWSAAAVVPAERRRIGMVFQDYALWPHMTVARNLAFGLDAQSVSPSETKRRIDHALEMVRLGPLRNRYPAELSGGQQQRVAIARCLAARPALMLFDEPLSNLDAALREDLRAEMMALVRQEGLTVLYVTHDQAEAMAVSDRIAMMRAGRIVQFDTPQRIYEQPADAFVAAFIGGFSLLPGSVTAGCFRIRQCEAPTLETMSAMTGEGILVLRPEDARAPERHPTNRLHGVVQSRSFQGRCWRLGVGLGPHQVRLDWPEGPPVGTTIEFSLAPERCTVLAG